DPVNIDGDANEIWMRQPGQSISTSMTVPSTIVSIHMVGDSDDGLADVLVDGVLVAQLDMGTTGASQTVLIVVRQLPNAPHQVDVLEIGAGTLGGDDVATLGAAALDDNERKWSQPPVPSDVKVFYGWNEHSEANTHQIVADDWMCESPGPLTDIHWWGSFLGWTYAADPAMMPDGFVILIWTNVPAGVDEPFSHPGEVIWEIYCTDYTWKWVGWDYDPRNPDAGLESCFKFEQTLEPEEYFHQEWYGSERIYWVSIAA
ncbi:unnamed protein product, partial [marine sediment metagenome]